MGTSFLIFSSSILLNGWLFEGEVLRVEGDPKRPEGFNCRLRIFKIDATSKTLHLLIDNHDHYGVHYHDKLPEVHDSRVTLEDQTLKGAFSFFVKKAKEITDEDIENSF